MPGFVSFLTKPVIQDTHKLGIVSPELPQKAVSRILDVPGVSIRIVHQPDTKKYPRTENMSIMIAEVYEALIEAGASEEKAKAAASAVPAEDRLSTKSDIQEVWSELKLLKFAVFSLYPFILAITYRIFS